MLTKTKTCLLCFVLLAQGCGDWKLFTPSLAGLEDRYALGSSDELQATLTTGDVAISSSDPSIVEVELLDEYHIRLDAVGVGTATLVLNDAEGSYNFQVEVAALDPARTRMELLEADFFDVVPVAPIAGKSVLAGRDQQLAVRYFDEHGPLYGSGLATIELPETSSECEKASVEALDIVCAAFEGTQEHVLSVSVGSDSYFVSFNSVERSAIVDLVLIAEDEANLTQGDIARVDAVGVTESGKHVYGIGAMFSAPEKGTGVGYFSYEFHPNAEPQELEVTALNFRKSLSFRGAPETVDSVSTCAAAPWRSSGFPPLLVLGLLVAARRAQRGRA